MAARFCVRCSCIARHCQFTPAETVVAFGALVSRLDEGKWPVLGADALNKAVKHLGPKFNVLSVQGKQVHVAPAYFKFHPAVFLRMFDAGLSDALSLN